MNGRSLSWVLSQTALVTASIVLAVFIFPVESQAATLVSTSTFSNFGTVTWTVAQSPYVVTMPISKRSGSFTVEPGVVVKFMPNATLAVHADVVATVAGTLESPIYFTSYKDDSVGGDTNGDGDASMPMPGDWGSVSFGGGATNNSMSLKYVKVRYGGATSISTVQGTKFFSLSVAYPWFTGSPGVVYTLSSVEVSHSSGIGLYLSIGSAHTVVLSQSSLSQNAAHGVYRRYSTNTSGFLSAGRLTATDNWWGDSSGPYQATLNPGGLGNPVDPTALHVNLGGSVAFTPWLTANPIPDPVPQPTCCSSVLFLPGIMGSELYDSGNKLWEPDNEQDVIGLYLDPAGKSVSNSVVATDVIKTFDGIVNVRLYDSFLNDLAQAKNDGTVDDYRAAAYDWRLSVPDIIATGELEAIVRQLASTSHTEKVMIVAHSNGGLVAKALINQLGPDAESLIDKLVLVGVPQLGTPQAIAALLHGADAGIRFSFSEERARDFARNAPFAYHLLPHQDYYVSTGAIISTPYVTFDPGVPQEFIDAYGSELTTGSELRNFILGSEGRTSALYSDLDHPSVGNQQLFDNAVSYLSTIGGSWTAPSGIEVHQIAGVGEDTLAGITYKPSKRCVERYVSPNSTPTCLRYMDSITFEPNEVIDGDGTVVEPSALAMRASSNATYRWWVDLGAYQADHLFEIGPFAKTHKNLFEVDEFSAFVMEDLLAGSEGLIEQYIYDVRPAVSSGRRLKFTLHSPLSLSAEDINGNKIGESDATIPGASYKRYGEVQVIWVPKEANPTLKLVGESEGSFTLEVEEYSGDTKTSETAFVGVPSTAGTVVTMSLPDGTIETAGELKLDYDGNGIVDVALAPEAGSEVRLPKLVLSVTAENKTIKLGEPILALSYVINGLPPGVSEPETDIVGAAECTTTATPSSPIGTYPITCTVGTLTSDYYSFETFVAGTLTINYSWSGFQQPIDDPVAQVGATPSIFKAGSTVPVKFKLRDVSGNIVQATVLPQWLTPTRGAPLSGSVDEPVYSDPATTGNTYRYDSTNQQYIYNWKTARTDAGYWYKVYVKLDDGTIKSVMIGLK